MRHYVGKNIGVGWRMEIRDRKRSRTLSHTCRLFLENSLLLASDVLQICSLAWFLTISLNPACCTTDFGNSKTWLLNKYILRLTLSDPPFSISLFSSTSTKSNFLNKSSSLEVSFLIRARMPRYISSRNFRTAYEDSSLNEASYSNRSHNENRLTRTQHDLRLRHSLCE